jgi:hypothetical protein
MAFDSSLLSKSCVIELDPLHSVDKRLMVVDTEALEVFVSAEALVFSAPVPPLADDTLRAAEDADGPAALLRRLRSSRVKPCSASGLGSTFFLMNLSAREAKHLRAPLSATAESSCLRSALRHSTDDARLSSLGSTLVQSLDTTDMAEWRVSLWMMSALSLMKERTQASPPASKTDPASRVQMSSKTLMENQLLHSGLAISCLFLMRGGSRNNFCCCWCWHIL